TASAVPSPSTSRSSTTSTRARTASCPRPSAPTPARPRSRPTPASTTRPPVPTRSSLRQRTPAPSPHPPHACPNPRLHPPPSPTLRPAPSRPPARQRTIEASVSIDGRTQTLRQGTNTFGRSSLSSDFVIDDPGFSRRHFEIIVEGDHAVANDLGSTNGTILH